MSVAVYDWKFACRVVISDASRMHRFLSDAVYDWNVGWVGLSVAVFPCIGAPEHPSIRECVFARHVRVYARAVCAGTHVRSSARRLRGARAHVGARSLRADDARWKIVVEVGGVEL